MRLEAGVGGGPWGMGTTRLLCLATFWFARFSSSPVWGMENCFMPGVWYAEAVVEESEEGSSTERTASARMPSCRRRSMTSRCCARMCAFISLLPL